MSKPANRTGTYTKHTHTQQRGSFLPSYGSFVPLRTKRSVDTCLKEIHEGRLNVRMLRLSRVVNL